jgi:predicted DNA-binding transcriptional regulator AlpA
MENRKILRAKEVRERISISRVTLWRWERDGYFPKRVRLGGPNSRAVGFYSDEIDNFIESLPRVETSLND